MQPLTHQNHYLTIAIDIKVYFCGPLQSRHCLILLTDCHSRYPCRRRDFKESAKMQYFHVMVSQSNKYMYLTMGHHFRNGNLNNMHVVIMAGTAGRCTVQGQKINKKQKAYRALLTSYPLTYIFYHKL